MSKATLKAWTKDGEVSGVAESLGARKVAVEVDPLLPKGSLEKTADCEHSGITSSSVLVRRWQGQRDISTLAPGHALCKMRPREGRDKQEPAPLTSSLASR